MNAHSHKLFEVALLFACTGVLELSVGVPTKALAAELLPVVEATLTAAPQVPPPLARKTPAHVIVRLVVKEFIGEVAPGLKMELWGYNGQVPGPFIRVREGDDVEFHVINDREAKNSHTVDFHAVIGPCGAACWLLTEPGKEKAVVAKMLHPGLYIYHCAAPPIPVHIAKGLYGLILVEPKQGLPKVDREYYILQSEFYTEGTPNDDGVLAFSSQKGMEERPTFVVFNGKVGAIAGDNGLKAKVGETVRLYVGNIGPNLVSSFHVIGGIFDRVYREGSLSNAERDIQTTLIPAGAASTVELKLQVPGDFTLVDHSIFRINKGALGTLRVEGAQNPSMYRKIEVKP